MLKEVNLQNLKNLKGEKKCEVVKQYQDEKQVLILEYMKLQDIVDGYNEQIQEICCKIQQINIILDKMGES